MFIYFTNQGKILGVFQRKNIVSAVFDDRNRQVIVLCEAAGREIKCTFPSKQNDFAKFVKKLGK